MSIADGVSGCAEAFRKLQAIFTDRTAQTDEKTEANSVFATKTHESFERFQLWSSNLGAHRRDKSSLDRRLWEASHLRDRVIEYLEDLQQGLADAFAIVSGVRPPWDEVSISSSEGDEDEDDEDTTELEQLATYISNTISCLLRISIVIQKPAPHDRFIKSGRFDQSFRQPWDEQYIRDKFASVPEWLTERLGKAISRRRQFLEYRKTHHERIAGSEASNDAEDAKTVASSLPSVVKQHSRLTVESENQSDAGRSETSYAETTAGEKALSVPKMPVAAQDGGMFECPYCFMITSGINSRSQWKRHVFTDLQPYICLRSDCVSADATFARRHNWIEHEIHFHSAVWKCNLGCTEIFLSENSMEQHFAKIHGFEGHTKARLLALSIRVEREQPKQQPCPLCHTEINSLSRYHKHVARHLEELALFAIPRSSIEDEDTEENSDENGSEDEDEQALIASSEQGSKDGNSEKNREEAADANFRLEAFLARDPLGKEAVADITAEEVADATKRDADRLDKLERLILAQKDEQQLREEASEAQRRAKTGGREAEKVAVEKLAALKVAESLLWAAKKERDEVENNAVAEAAAAKTKDEKALADAAAAAAEAQKAAYAAESKPSDATKPPIKFKDAVGRKFSFPWHLCKTWKGMEELIRQAFLRVDVLGPHVHEGHYDLVGPDGEIILPQVWETMVQPDWVITMHMWPIPEPWPLDPMIEALPASTQDSSRLPEAEKSNSETNIEDSPAYWPVSPRLKSPPQTHAKKSKPRRVSLANFLSSDATATVTNRKKLLYPYGW